MRAGNFSKLFPVIFLWEAGNYQQCFIALMDMVLEVIPQLPGMASKGPEVGSEPLAVFTEGL